MQIESTVLFIVDVQNGFITDASAHVVPRVADLGEKWGQLGGHIVCSRYHNYTGSNLERLMNWRYLYDSPDTDLVPQLDSIVTKAATIDKQTYSGLTRDMLQLIRRNRWTDIIICGIDTDLCVLATVMNTFDQGLTPWVITDASASTGGSEVHEAALLVMARAIGGQQLLTSEQVLTMAAPGRPTDTRSTRC